MEIPSIIAVLTEITECTGTLLTTGHSQHHVYFVLHIINSNTSVQHVPQ